uniref:Uncharacterized protein n=1 Tax=Chrysemys picta bellii TaxID=8478 RepID=A0A8C3I6S5_CHRPI
MSGERVTETPEESLQVLQEILQFNLILSSHFPVILSLPWLSLYNQSISWATQEVRLNSRFCQLWCRTRPSIGEPQGRLCTSASGNTCPLIVPLAKYSNLANYLIKRRLMFSPNTIRMTAP